MSTYYPPGYGRVQGPSGATGGLGSTQTGYRDPMRRRLARPAGPAQVPPPYATGPYSQFQDIMREAALNRRMQGPTEQPPFSPVTTDAMLQEPPIDMTQQPVEPMGPPTIGAGEDAAGLDFESAYEALLRRADEQARQAGVTEGNAFVAQRRQRQGYSVADTVNEVSNAIQRRLAELMQGVLR